MMLVCLPFGKNFSIIQQINSRASNETAWD
jgi:hypothetical protein